MSQCGICTDLFDGIQRVMASPCGHVYHSTCLLKWLDVSKTCPECRKKVCRDKVLELYFNINTTESVNPASLHNEVENLKTLLQERITEAQGLVAKGHEMRDIVVKHEATIDALHQKNLALEIKYNNSMRKMCEVSNLRVSLDSEKQKTVLLEEELKCLQDIKKVVVGTQEEADEILHQNADLATQGSHLVAKKLAYCCSLTKRELKLAINEKNDLRRDLAESRKTLGLTLTKLRHSKAKVAELQQRVEELEENANNTRTSVPPDSEPSTSHNTPPPRRSPKKSSEVTPIITEFDQRDKKMNVVVLTKERGNILSCNRSVSPVQFSSVPKRRLEKDSVSRTGYNGLGGHHSIIIRAEDLPKDGRAKKYTLVPTKKKFRKL